MGSGARLGPYEIVAALGVGGMGEVYRAIDTALGRQVAIKVLPEAFATDPERLARFEREAKTLAALNHPNIAQIYGLERSGNTPALVMELVEGETLAERIARAPLPIDEALPIARQIAEALEAAHEQGIIHRDLKPANIKIRKDGTVKVLDFGLAKALEPISPRGVDATASATITSPAMVTGVGVLLGTAAYMSPEQARSKTVDKRTDIWAFGTVLYEMLTGRQAFGGNSVSDLIASILTKEPDWSALPQAAPPAIRRLLRRSLEKDPKRRLPDVADARIEIDDAPNESGAVKSIATKSESRLAMRERLGWIVGMLIAAALGTAAALGLFLPPVSDDLPEMRVDIAAPSTPDTVSLALSPDGRRLVFVAPVDGTPHLWLRPLDEAAAQVLTGTEGASYPFWSPDSRSVGFFAGGRLKRMDIGSSASRTLANAAPGVGGAWSTSGVIIFAPGASTPLSRVSANGGEAVALTRLDPPRQAGHAFPTFLPGGREFLFYARGTEEGQGIYIGSLDSADTTRLTGADRPPVAYVMTSQTTISPRASRLPGSVRETGWLLFMQQGTLVARHFDQVKKTLVDDPVSVADSVVSGGGVSIAYTGAAFSASADGLVAYRTGGTTQTQLTWFDRSGRTLGTVGPLDASGLLNPELSPDDRRVGVRRTVENNPDIWLLDDVRATRFTFEAASDQYPVWSPDGSWLAFTSARKGAGNLYRKRSSGAGSEELLFESSLQKNVDDWSPDGRFLLYNAEDPATGRDLWVLPLDDERKPFIFLKTNFEEHRGQFSPDGRLVAYVSNESGRHEIYVRPFPGPGGQWQVSTAGGIQPRWSHDGTQLYYIAPDATLMTASIVVKDVAIEPGAPRALFQTRIASGGTNAYTRPQYDVASDGRFLINTAIDEASTSPITLLLNWRPER